MIRRTFAEEISDRIVRELSGTFPRMEHRIRTMAETDKYRWKEDESVWKQKRGIDSKKFECYMDGEFVCFFDEALGEQENWKIFLEAFKNLYKTGKIFVHEELYKVKQAEIEAKKEKENVVDVPTATTPEEKQIASVLIKHLKKRGKKIRRV